MFQRYLPPTLLLIAGLTLLLLSGVRRMTQSHPNGITTFLVTQTPSVLPSPTKTPLYAPTRTPASAARQQPVTPSPTVTSVPPIARSRTPQSAESNAGATTQLDTPTTTAPPAATNLPTQEGMPDVVESNFAISYRDRFGVSGSVGDTAAAQRAGLNFGSFITWELYDTNRLSADVSAWQMVRVSQEGVQDGLERLGVAVRANPGGIFVIGNEPDVAVQDNTTAPRYAEIYHDAYVYIKRIDPTAQVAIAGVASPTPLRRTYLERVLAHYEQTYGEKMPIDIWTVHVYVLREERNSWGIGIPTGFDEIDQGQLYDIDDHKNAAIANQLLTDFRGWLSEIGYRNSPLAITEFGILLPADYGFPPEVVANYMTTLVNYYLNAAGEIGFPSDGNRLVQWWFWFSLIDTDQFEVSDMLDQFGQLTPVGQAYADYLR